MAIKQFHFSFKLDAKDLLEYVTQNNVAVEIQAFGTPPKQPKAPKQLPAPKVLALPPPSAPHKPGTRKLGATNAMLLFMAAHPKQIVTSAGLRALLIQQGYSKHTLNNAVWSMKQNGLIRIPKGLKGQYRVTPKGTRHAEEIAHG